MVQNLETKPMSFHPAQAGMAPHLSQGFFVSDAPKSLAQLCHLQDSALAFLPLPMEGGAPRALLYDAWGYFVQPATHLSSPGS